MKHKQRLLALATVCGLAMGLTTFASAAYEEYLPKVTGFQEERYTVGGSDFLSAAIYVDRTPSKNIPDDLSGQIAIGDPEQAAANGHSTTAKMLSVTQMEFVDSYGPVVDEAAVGEQFSLPVWELVANWDMSQANPYGGLQARRDSGCQVCITVEAALTTPDSLNLTSTDSNTGIRWTAELGSGYETGTYVLQLDYGDYRVWWSANVANPNQSLTFTGTASRAFTGDLTGAQVSLRRIQYGHVSADGSAVYLEVTQAPSSQSQQPAQPEEQPSSWAQAEVNAARAAGLIPAELDGQFQSNITRGEFCLLAASFLEAETGKTLDAILAEAGVTPLSFTDSSDPVVSAMSALGVVNGVGNGLFRPDSDITREEAAVMLWRLAQLLGGLQPNLAQTPFADQEQISSWALDAVSTVSACESGGVKLMNGTGGNQFSPKGTYTREQSFLTMLRLSNCLN